MKFKDRFLFGKKNIFICLTLLFSMSFIFSTIKAQSELGIPEGIQISPARFDLDLKSGDQYTGKVNLKNYDTKNYEVFIEIEDFYVSDDSTEAKFFIPDEHHSLYAYDVINWIEITDKVDLAPGESKDVYYQIKVPEKTPTGGYYGALFFKTSNFKEIEDASSEESKILVSQRIGSLLVIAVKGDEPISRSGNLIDFKSKKKIYFFNPIELEASVENSGNLHYKAFGKIDIFKFGKKIKTIELSPQVIYPDKIRKYLENWQFSAWGFGYYKAQIDLLSEDKGIAITGSTNFGVIPFKTTISIIILLIIIILIFKIFTSKFEIKPRINKKENNEQEEFFHKNNQEDQNDEGHN